MWLPREQAFVLFSLGRCFEECDRRFSNKPLRVSLSKKNFIHLARAAGMVQKGERAVYKNLEDLEKKRLVSYRNSSLSLTAKGEKAVDRIARSIRPYIAVSSLLGSRDILKYIKVQAKFK